MDVATLKADIEAVDRAIKFVEHFHKGPVLNEIDQLLTQLENDDAALTVIAPLIGTGQLVSMILSLLALLGKRPPQEVHAALQQMAAGS